MTFQDTMKVKTFLERMMDRKAQIAGMFVQQEKAEHIAMAYAHLFERAAIEALDLLGEIEWPEAVEASK